MISNTLSSNVNGTFSANVKLHLYVDGKKFEVGSLGPSFAYLRTASPIPEGSAELETIVDEKETRWPIRITSELNVETRRFEFEGVALKSFDES